MNCGPTRNITCEPFSSGAYQETLGDLHNLLGDTNVLHVRAGPTARLNTPTKSRAIRWRMCFLSWNTTP